jgi:POT family proton-dependent oligopeptide transporter
MSKHPYLTAPDPKETGWPKGVPYIIGNEGCERFSFYGMKSVLQVHLTALYVAQPMREQLAEEHAQEMVHLFVAGVYAFPMIGAIIADRLLGKYATILWLSLVYCLGHFVLSVGGENSIQGMMVGLGLIAIGSGGIKPCVSAHVGDQFGKSNWFLVEKVFQAFYFIINFGSFFATIAIPWIRAWEEPLDLPVSIAFGLPGVLMFIATIAFWMGRHVFVHVPAKPGGLLGLLDALASTCLFMGFVGLPMFGMDFMSRIAFWSSCSALVAAGLGVFFYRQSLEKDDGFIAVGLYSIMALFNGANGAARAKAASEPKGSIQRNWFFAAAAQRFGKITAEGPRAVIRIVSVFFIVSMFWALFDQHASSWIRQAKQMNLKMWGGWSLLPSQISALNPLMVMALIPFNNFVLYPLMDKYVFKMTPLRKMTLGMFGASLAFGTVAILQMTIDKSGIGQVHALWQIVPYLVITQAEVMVSITGLEFAYTQAPSRMKSTIMGFWLLFVSVGNKFVAVVTKFQTKMLAGFENIMGSVVGAERLKGMSELAMFFWLFTCLMFVAAALFGTRAMFYTYKSYTQGDEE